MTRITTILLLAACLPGQGLCNENAAESHSVEAAIEATNEPTQTLSQPGNDANTNTTKQGETIWLEKKLAPTTRWLEQIAKPVSSWMERKIQRQESDGVRSPPKTTWMQPAPIADTESYPGSPPRISTEQVSTAAKRHIAGEVLAVKLLRFAQAAPQYRVKLLSTAGEIHILYFDAETGTIIQPTTTISKE